MVKYESKVDPETNEYFHFGAKFKKLQYRTWKSEAPSAGSWTIERVWTDWMDVPTVELDNINV